MFVTSSVCNLLSIVFQYNILQLIHNKPDIHSNVDHHHKDTTISATLVSLWHMDNLAFINNLKQ